MTKGQLRALELAIGGAPLREVLGAIVAALESACRNELRGSVLLIEERDSEIFLTFGAGPSLPAAYNEAIDGLRIGDEVGSCGTAAYLGRTVVVSDIATDPLWRDFRDLALSHGLRACWSTPIRASSGRVLGTFALYYDRPAAPTEEQLEAAHLLASTAAVIIERDMEAAARSQAQAALDESAVRLQLIIDSVPGLISYVGRDERYELVNKAYKTWFGSEATFTGRAVREVVGGDAWRVAGPHLSRALAGERVTYENVVRIHDGRIRAALTTYTPHFDLSGGVLGVIAQVTDITDHKSADREQRFKWQLREETQALSDPTEIVRTTARLLAEHLEVSRCAYAEVEGETVFNVTGDYSRGVSSIVGKWKVKSFGAECDRLMLANQAFVVADSTNDPRISENDLPAYAATAIGAVICVPLHKEGRLTAAMAVHSTTPRKWTLRELDLVRTVVARCWESLERARATRELLESEAKYRTLFESLDEGFLLADVQRDEDGNAVDLYFLDSNDAAIHQVGSDYTGRRLMEISPDFEPYWLEIWGRVGASGVGERHQRFAAPLARWFSFYTFAVGGRADRVAVLFRDVTTEKAREDALVASDARHAFTVALTDALRPLADAELIEGTTTELLGRHLGVSRSFYVHFDEKAGTGYVLRDYVADAGRTIAGVYRIDEWPLNARLRLGQPVGVPDVLDPDVMSPAEAAGFTALGIRSLLAVPLVKNGLLVAALLVAHAQARAWPAQDVSLLQETAERTWGALERARVEQALYEADRRKDEFLATLAHELRNPLAPLRNGLQVAKRSQTDPVQVRMIEMMDRQLTHLVRLVDDLLDVARINAGKIDLRLEPVAMQSVLATSLEQSRTLLESHEQTVAVHVPSEALHVLGDADRLVQVFSNLLSNAAKYSNGPGQVEIQLTSEQGEAVVTIVDTGIGIPRSELGHVFDLFSQVRAHQARAGGGLGIGLSLVKNLVLQHKGQVTAWSEGTGNGSTFKVKLPLSTFQSGSASPAPVPRAGRTGSHRILVVDDNADAADSLAMLLELNGHAVGVAHGGLEALSMAEAGWPDAVFLDLGMPGLDGFAAARRLRTLAGSRSLFLVAMTGWGQAADRVKTAAAGFDRHLVKPAELEDIERLLAELSLRPQVPPR